MNREQMFNVRMMRADVERTGACRADAEMAVYRDDSADNRAALAVARDRFASAAWGLWLAEHPGAVDEVQHQDRAEFRAAYGLEPWEVAVRARAAMLGASGAALSDAEASFVDALTACGYPSEAVEVELAAVRERRR